MVDSDHQKRADAGNCQHIQLRRVAIELISIIQEQVALMIRLDWISQPKI